MSQYIVVLIIFGIAAALWLYVNWGMFFPSEVEKKRQGRLGKLFDWIFPPDMRDKW